MSRGWSDLPRWRVPFNWRALGRKNLYLMRTTGKVGRSLGGMGAMAALYGANQASWLLDQFVSPGWDKVPMNGPVFIIGHQRTGSTLLHRTLVKDPNAVAMTLSEMLFPAISARRTTEAFWGWDARRGGKLRQRFDAFQDRKLAHLDAIHSVRLNRIEEDEFLLFGVYRSGMAINSTPAVAADPELNRLRDFSTWSDDEKQAALGWYRACLLKALYRAETDEPNPDRWIVGKNPAFSQRIPDLLKVFPNAKFIHLVRNPLETIPSRLSLVQAVQGLRNPGARLTEAEIGEVMADSIRTYLFAQRDLAGLPPETAINVRFEDLTTDLPAVLDRIYHQLRLPGRPPAVSAERADGQRHGGHTYTLDEFGIDEADLRDRLRPVFERYGW